MIETDNFHELKAKEWLDISFNAILSHKNKSKIGFYRNSNDTTEALYSTASLHCFSTWENYKYINNINGSSANEIEQSYISFYELINNYTSKQIIENSSNNSNKEADFRIYIILERFINCLYVYRNEQIVKYIEKDIHYIKSLLDIGGIINKSQPGTSPLLILKLSQIIIKLREINVDLLKIILDDKIESIVQTLTDLSKSHIDYHMARYQVDEETTFDTVSLATVIYSRSILNPEWKNSSFFNKCLEVVMKSQYQNGCWPAGVSISFSKNADIVQLPSIEIACYIIDSAIDKEILIDHNSEIEKRLTIILPGLRNFAKFLELTYQEFTEEDTNFKGWSSDRLGIKQYTEAWISSMVNRFYFKYWIAEKAYLRNKALNRLGCHEFKAKSLNKERSIDYWQNEVIEIDNEVQPIGTIFQFISFILDQKEKGAYLCFPHNDMVSMVLLGPPGSGKTTIVEKVASTLDWPLIELSPGHFIKNGLELIESTSKELFELLSNVNHAVVLFDECDELFRDRRENGSVARSILSFATASMLPKLQKLHDRKNILFILNTNYLHKMDDAVIRKGRFDEILLIDRPDEQSRARFILRFDKQKRITNMGDAIRKTTGFTIKEIKDFCIKGEGANNTKLEYIEWCATTGKEELGRSKFNETNKKIIQSRWCKVKKS